LMLKSYLPEL